MTKDEALTLALEALENGMKFVWTDPEREAGFVAIDAIKEALAQPEQDDRRLQIAMRQWEDWKAYALELQKKLVKYEGGSPMILNTQPVQESVTTYTCGVCGVSMQMERPWVGLTNKERDAIQAVTLDLHEIPKFFATAIEAKLKEKNT